LSSGRAGFCFATASVSASAITTSVIRVLLLDQELHRSFYSP
jgi:hypothetical protein